MRSHKCQILQFYSKSAAMGVYGLWDILLTVASKKDISHFSGYTIAIDASIWIMKVNSVFDSDVERLKSIFNKVLWLKKHNIKPIFIFDGTSPALKRKTVEERRQRRRELNDLDIQKKAQISLLRQIQNKGTKKQGQSAENKKQIDEKLKQTDIMLAQLILQNEEIGGVQLEEKKRLQTELLDKRYELACEVNENLSKKYGMPEEFQLKDFEQKLQILDEIERGGFSNQNYRNFRKQLSTEEKIIYDMELMKKKAKIREMQDRLYRKISQKKRQNGYQIIETIQNGKKLIQKRKIAQTQQSNNYDIYLHGKKTHLSNDFKAIFNQKREELDENKARQSGDFFSNIFNKDYTKQTKKTNIDDIVRKSQELMQKKNQSSDSQSEFSSSSREKQSDESFDFSEPDLLLFSGQIDEKNVQPNEDPDNFPDFLQMENLDSLPTSNDNIQVQNLLTLLGVDFFIAPEEAQAECAALQLQNIVDAIATEDSDVFLFGGKTIIRGLFQDNLKVYSAQNIERQLKLNREKMILLGMLLGSDYTEGIKGIGIVNAMEIVKVFGDIQSLKKLTDWAQTSDKLLDDDFKTQNMLLKSQTENQRQFFRLHRKYKNYWHVNKKFPEEKVYNAYLHPHILDYELVKKKLGQKNQIKEEIVQQIMGEKFGMGIEQRRHNMKILDKKYERRKQVEIEDYFGGELAKIKSKRLQKAIN